jgi:hypothetical protein
MDDSKATYQGLIGKEFNQAITAFSNLNSADLFKVRKDICGKPTSEVTRLKRPEHHMRTLGAIQLMLFAKGATLHGPTYVLGDTRVRVVLGVGELLSHIKARFATESEVVPTCDIVICVGADDDGGAATNIVRQDTVSSIIRPTSTGEWITHGQAIERLELDQ